MFPPNVLKEVWQKIQSNNFDQSFSVGKVRNIE